MDGAYYPPEQKFQEYPQPYPPQEYPPQQPGYLPPQQGYPPQQTFYPPQQQGYPDTGYPVDGYKGGVPPPPPYYGQQQQPVQQQSSSNVVVVQQQPTAVYTQTAVHASGDNFLTLSIVLTILCFLCGTWYSLLCTIPAIFLASAARDAERSGDLVGARQKRNAALICNIIACVWWVVAFLIIVIPIAVIANSNNYYYDSYYDSYSSYYSCYYNSYYDECSK